MIKRKNILCEKYSSSVYDRKTETSKFKKLNPQIDMDSIEFIYSLRDFKRTPFSLSLIKFCLKARLFNLMNWLVADVDSGEDEIGYVPIGDYVHISVWKNIDNEYFAQLKGGSYTPHAEYLEPFLIETFKLKHIYPRLILHRTLTYPI